MDNQYPLTHRQGNIMKSLIKKFFQLLEDFGRAKAASALAREGKYEQARNIVDNKIVAK
jgi:hypothetical protein